VRRPDSLTHETYIVMCEICTPQTDLEQAQDGRWAATQVQRGQAERLAQ
jgi:hypothetical protein